VGIFNADIEDVTEIFLCKNFTKWRTYVVIAEAPRSSCFPASNTMELVIRVWNKKKQIFL